MIGGHEVSEHREGSTAFNRENIRGGDIVDKRWATDIGRGLIPGVSRSLGNREGLPSGAPRTLAMRDLCIDV